MKFYFQRPTLSAELVHEGDLGKEDFQFLIDEFKTLIDIEFMQRIGEEYWEGARPSEFNLYIFINVKKERNDFNYIVNSRYNKTHVSDEDLDNIDGYKTWQIRTQHDEIIL